MNPWHKKGKHVIKVERYGSAGGGFMISWGAYPKSKMFSRNVLHSQRIYISKTGFLFYRRIKINHNDFNEPEICLIKII